mgnify:CR=1 FL=1
MKLNELTKNELDDLRLKIYHSIAGCEDWGSVSDDDLRNEYGDRDFDYSEFFENNNVFKQVYFDTTSKQFFEVVRLSTESMKSLITVFDYRLVPVRQFEIDTIGIDETRKELCDKEKLTANNLYSIFLNNFQKARDEVESFLKTTFADLTCDAY